MGLIFGSPNEEVDGASLLLEKINILFMNREKTDTTVCGNGEFYCPLKCVPHQEEITLDIGVVS